MGDVTRLIEQAREGDTGAVDRIFELLYPDLREVAHRRLARHERDGSLDTTALVNECYLKFVRRDQITPTDRAHFLAYAATVMRSIIVDVARQSLAERRGGDAPHVTLNTDMVESLAQPSDEIVDIDAALREVAKVDQRLVRVVEMRYFGGMKDAEIAQALGLSERTVNRDWEKARLLLAHALRG